jgi:NADH-quinone oxidoreductase subunit M
MAETDLIWMSLVVFLPTVFAVALVFFPRGSDEAMRWWSLFGTAITLGASLCMLVHFYKGTLEKDSVLTPGGDRYKATLEYRVDQRLGASTANDWQSDDYVTRYPWIGRFNIQYYMGADGISVALVLLTTVLSFLAMIASWKIDRFVKGYCILFLVLETGMLGTFLALDFFLFYIFWEVMLLPMYFLIGIWGGPRREYAAIKFFLYTLFGSVFILIALLAFYFTDVSDFVSPGQREEAVERARADNPTPSAGQAEVHTFDIVVLAHVGRGALQFRNGQPVTSAWDARVLLTSAEALRTGRPVSKEEIAAVKGLVDWADKHGGNQQRTDQLRAVEKALASLAPGQPAPDDAKRAQALAEQSAEQARAHIAQQQQAFFQPWFQYTMFLFLLVGFAIKVPVFPFHTWLPDAHVEAPTPISMILAGVLLKMGGYGIIRIAYPICPWAAEQLAWWVALFGIINIVYGAFAAMAQTDFKKLVAYSSISHMGYVLLGIAVWSSPDHRQFWAWGMNGAMFQMLAHGISSAGMFFLVGVIYDRAHHRNLDNFRGLYEPMPLYGGISAVIFFAAMGLPGLCGFVGEFMVVLSAWNFAPPGAPHAGPVFSLLAAMTVVLTAAYILWTLQRVFMGTNAQYKNYSDMTVREIVCIVPLVILAIVLGVAPSLVINWMEPSVTGLVDTLAIIRR